MFYKLLGFLTWKVIKAYVHDNVPTKKIAAGVIVGTVGAIALSAALKGHEEET